MARVLLWWTVLVASVMMLVIALGDRSGWCVDAPDPSATSCSNQGAGGLVLAGLAALVLSVWMLRRTCRSRRR